MGFNSKHGLSVSIFLIVLIWKRCLVPRSLGRDNNGVPGNKWLWFVVCCGKNVKCDACLSWLRPLAQWSRLVRFGTQSTRAAWRRIVGGPHCPMQGRP